MSAAKKPARILTSPPTHWVGDGFPVSSVFAPRSVGESLSPYILMDYAGPAWFEPADEPRGVDMHPHRGFETVTVVYQGELEHRDSAGKSGRIGPGDVQWMTAASGVLHEEKHSSEFTRQGGDLEMAQLWVNLPAKHKMSAPRYQEVQSGAIPVVTLPKEAGTVRIIAGDFQGTKGAAETFTPVVLWDMTLGAGAKAHLPLPEGFNAAIYVRRGGIQVGETHSAHAREIAVLSRQGAGIVVRAQGNSELLILGGEPIDEPVVAYGPFVMNTPEEIEQAIVDTRAGRLGWSG
ncbi:MAG: pirin family protein [Planctomycetaceae bacterium]